MCRNSHRGSTDSYKNCQTTDKIIYTGNITIYKVLYNCVKYFLFLRVNYQINLHYGLPSNKLYKLGQYNII